MIHLRTAVTISVCIAFSAPAWAGQTFTMTFDNISKAEGVSGQDFGSAVLGFYNGDPIFQRVGRQTWNTTFSPNALAICSDKDSDNCFGQFPPSPLPGSGGSAIANIDEDSDGFFLTLTEGLYVTALSFRYTDDGEGSSPGATLIYEDGKTEAIVEFSECDVSFCEWKQLSAPGELLAKGRVISVEFLGTANKVVFDDISLTTSGSASIPEPSTYALIGTGLLLLAGISYRRASATQ